MGKKKSKKSKTGDEALKKDVVTDPNILKQELEVLIKNLNREQNLQEKFIVKDDEVSDVDDGELSGDDEIVESLEEKKQSLSEPETKKSKKDKKKVS